MNREILSIPIDKILQIENSRITYSQEDLSELMQSMKYRGLLSPIGVRPVKSNHGKYECVFGNRRLIAAGKLDWKTIDAVLADAATDEDMLLVNATENLQRKDPPFAEQGRIFFGLQKKGYTTKEIATKIGISPERVKRIIHMYRKLPKKMRNKVYTGGRGIQAGVRKVGMIPASTAHLAIDLSTKFQLPKDKREKLLHYAQKPEVTLADVRRIAGQVKQGVPLGKAIKEAGRTRIITLSIPIAITHIEQLEKVRGKKIHDIIYEHLAEQKWLQMIHEKPEKIVSMTKKANGKTYRTEVA